MTLKSHGLAPLDSVSHSTDIELSRVRSFEKRQELENILHSDHPDHYTRLYLVGFLKYTGYSLEEICSIIDQENAWEDYDIKTTWLHVRSVFKLPGSPPTHFLTVLGEGARGRTLLQKGSPPCAVRFTACKDCPDKVCKVSFNDLAGGGEK